MLHKDMNVFPYIMRHNLTLVSSFVPNINSTWSTDKYLEYGYQLMKINIPKIIFIDHGLFDTISSCSNEYTTIIPFNFEDIYLFKFKEQLKNVSVNTSNPQKDTVEYFIFQCHKTEWVKKAIELNKYDSNQYMWVDFDAYYYADCLNNSPEVNFLKFSENLHQIEYQKTNLVKIPGMWNMDCCVHNVYEYLKKNICLYFAGTIFGGNKDSLVKFANYTKEKCLQMITRDSWLVWELNIWYLVYCDHPELFLQYKAQHNMTLFENYKDNLCFCVPLNKYDGLGNKLKAFIGGLSINKNTKIQSCDKLPYSNFMKILPKKYIHNSEKDTECLTYYTSRLPVLKREENEQENLVNEYSHHSFDVGELNYLFSQKHIDWYYDKNKLSSSLVNRILNVINSIQFLPHIYENVDNQTTFKGVTLVVSIRTWKASHENDIQRPYNSVVYKNKINEVLTKHKDIENIYVMIDNEKFLDEYIPYFKTLHQNIHFFSSSAALCDLENALIQVLIASKCQYMIGNRISSFTELIWWFSNLKIQAYNVF